MIKIGNHTLYYGDCLEVLNEIPDNSIDMILTSPPYDNLRTYNDTCEWSLDIFKNIADKFPRKLKEGGVIIWVVADSTINGSETGTSFKQALYFKDIGLKLHDTMLFRKINYIPLTHNRYEQEFEYMFCLSKGTPKTFNPIKIDCKYKGTTTSPSFYKKADGVLVKTGTKVIHDTKIKGNIFEYLVGSSVTGEYSHPAMFPLDLAQDQIKSWSNENDTILDCFMGSGTTGVACEKMNRKFIGIEKDKQYFDISVNRIKAEYNQIKLF